VAKTLVEDPEDKTRIPFLRGILIRSLQDSGVDFDTASDIASDIRQELDDTELISTVDLGHLVLKRLQSLKTGQIANRYRNRNLPLTVQVEHCDGRVTAFSRQEYRHSLQTIGLKSRELDKVVQTMQEHLLNRKIETITAPHLSMLTYRYLRQSSQLGPAVAHRWLVWHDFINSGREIIFLLGGTAGCGKSSTANLLASSLEIVRTQSTDMLREVMRTMMPRGDEVPEDLLIQGYRSQADLLFLAIEAVIARATRERVSLVLEGVHLHPTLIEKLQTGTDAVVIPIMLGLLKRKHLQQRIKKRSTNVPDRGAKHYMAHFEEIWQLQSYLLSEADRANVHITINESRDKTFAEIMRFTIATLAKNFDGTPEKVFGVTDDIQKTG
jgi:2-phosphoglycerate kinase